MSEKQRLEAIYKNARSNLLMMIVLTLLNTLLIFFNLPISFLFSAFIPQLFVSFAVHFNTDPLFSDVYYWCFSILSFAVTALYLPAYFQSKKQYGWLIFALVLFSLDFAALIVWIALYFNFALIFDILFHVWVMYYLIQGITTAKKISRLTDDSDADVVNKSAGLNAEAVSYETGANSNSRLNSNGEQENRYIPYISELVNTPLMRPFDCSKKHKVLLEDEYAGVTISVVRSKALTELVVNGNVYGERKGVIESDYVIEATVGGVKFATKYNSSLSRIHLYVNGEEIASKFRMFS